MTTLSSRTTYDCAPALDAEQVLDFCRTGFLRLDGVVSEDVNRLAVTFADRLGCRLMDPDKTDGNGLDEPVELFGEAWFVEGVLLNPAVTGAVRSILGPRFGLPLILSNHRVTTPTGMSAWHHDGDANFDEETHSLQCFYYPEEARVEDGPTEILPGSHLWPMQTSPRSMEAPRKGGRLTTCSAGSVFITDYPILHRRATSTVVGVRNNFKFNYFRTEAPQAGRRDWVDSPTFSLQLANFNPSHSLTHFEGPGTQALKVSAAQLVAKKLFWLMGEPCPPMRGGQAWPLVSAGREWSIATDGGWGAPEQTAPRRLEGWPPTTARL